ncbi:MAG TPA: hypothetical protein VL425_11555 [Rudaea sp.]|nr:hypothetical protein [Rudaea sp.]
MPILACWSHWYCTVPAVGKTTVSLHAEPLGALFVVQFAAQSKLVGPLVECALWKPPPLVNVTESPALMVRLDGVKAKSVAVTVNVVACTAAPGKCNKAAAKSNFSMTVLRNMARYRQRAERRAR